MHSEIPGHDFGPPLGSSEMRNRQKTKTVGNAIVNEAAEGAVASKPSAMGSIGISHGPGLR